MSDVDIERLRRRYRLATNACHEDGEKELAAWASENYDDIMDALDELERLRLVGELLEIAGCGDMARLTSGDLDAQALNQALRVAQSGPLPQGTRLDDEGWA